MDSAGMDALSPRLDGLRSDEMRSPDEVSALLRLRALGWGTKRIAAELGCSRNTVRRYVATAGWSAYRRPRRRRLLDGLEEWLASSFRQHAGNADVVRQELLRVHGVASSACRSGATARSTGATNAAAC